MKILLIILAACVVVWFQFQPAALTPSCEFNTVIDPQNSEMVWEDIGRIYINSVHFYCHNENGSTSVVYEVVIRNQVATPNDLSKYVNIIVYGRSGVLVDMNKTYNVLDEDSYAFVAFETPSFNNKTINEIDSVYVTFLY